MYNYSKLFITTTTISLVLLVSSINATTNNHNHEDYDSSNTPIYANVVRYNNGSPGQCITDQPYIYTSYLTGACVDGWRYYCKGNGAQVVYQAFESLGCTGNSFEYTYNTGKCITDKNFNRDGGSIYSCGTNYTIPDNTVSEVEYNVPCGDDDGQAVTVNAMVLGSCVPNYQETNQSFIFSACTEDTLTTQSFTSFNCSQQVKENTAPLKPFCLSSSSLVSKCNNN
ncbi:hypothetical protein DFA_06306 [Cavenderia fasciculata]|uniref:Uncharacterized protein n=1 Tax=Cavenderia fasciculata TaxID=261658 RepID=F4PKN6_CACFS|nr:uncharacterized protein DFA_06306 [Cavenderia fasciculata]EGG24160.1 hypothetical protein DFA_06306 [Cavenderia fasciculata]|eukprot:XP_004362011.1 hypothetical protein DFA_06306 [Cavenderia fasciculata]